MSESSLQRKKCVLMFSGGRDSTLSAVRLARSGFELVLATVTTDHLVGIQHVHARLAELSSVLPASTTWIHTIATDEIGATFSETMPTCLPCHQIYALIGVQIAAAIGATVIAFGYSGYQSAWVEQTPIAVEGLKAVLAGRGYELLLPVYDLFSKDEAVFELTTFGISTQALEQKCLRQQFNREIDKQSLERQVSAWKKSLADALYRSSDTNIEFRTMVPLPQFVTLHADYAKSGSI